MTRTPGRQFTCFTPTTVQILTRRLEGDSHTRSSVYLLYSYILSRTPGPQFTCFTPTYCLAHQVLSLPALLLQQYKYWLGRRRCRMLCDAAVLHSLVLSLPALLLQQYKYWLGGRRCRILYDAAVLHLCGLVNPTLRFALLVLYWYKSTNTDGAASLRTGKSHASLALLVLYWCKSTKTDGASMRPAAEDWQRDRCTVQWRVREYKSLLNSTALLV